jgi:hypothetical protein
MDVKSSQPQHVAQRLVRKPDAVAFVPPQRLEIQAGCSQEQAQQRQQRDQ